MRTVQIFGLLETLEASALTTFRISRTSSPLRQDIQRSILLGTMSVHQEATVDAETVARLKISSMTREDRLSLDLHSPRCFLCLQSRSTCTALSPLRAMSTCHSLHQPSSHFEQPCCSLPGSTAAPGGRGAHVPLRGPEPGSDPVHSLHFLATLTR